MRLSQADPLVPVVFSVSSASGGRGAEAVFLVLFGDPLAGRLAGSPTWTFSDSFSVVRLSSVLDRGLTTARLEVSSGFRYYFSDIKLPTFCDSNACKQQKEQVKSQL